MTYARLKTVFASMGTVLLVFGIGLYFYLGQLRSASNEFYEEHWAALHAYAGLSLAVTLLGVALCVVSLALKK